ncbi:MAG: bifunctional ornithine acetyltransferase/N-acetylglutamate synthase [Spirochaetales bacterium]|nr:bifunctional ornithine acetyltransferase/N-acetylglutamate synthase [Spirochaetales bacterium]
MRYTNSDAWQRQLLLDSQLPEGFSTGVTNLEFVPQEKPDAGYQPMNLALLRVDEPTPVFAGVFTQNAFPGWPVLAGKELLQVPTIQGILVNNRVANVGVPEGLEDSLTVTQALQEQEASPSPFIPSSTGVIGWKLPRVEMVKALGGLSERSHSLLPFAQAIMTTDSWPKVRRRECGDGSLVGCAKGAGMVEPNLATMLAFLVTDVAVERDVARRLLSEVVGETFNRISVDGETSTSDSVFLISSCKYPYPGDDVFRQKLLDVCASLSDDVVRNGEGCGHVMRITVQGAPHDEMAVKLARSIANAPLTKTAIRGNDPNVGRILQAAGAAAGRAGLELPREHLVLSIGNRQVFANGVFQLTEQDEVLLSQYMADCALPVPSTGWPVHFESVEVELNLGLGTGQGTVTGSDLSEEYVIINADYRT